MSKRQQPFRITKKKIFLKILKYSLNSSVSTFNKFHGVYRFALVFVKFIQKNWKFGLDSVIFILFIRGKKVYLIGLARLRHNPSVLNELVGGAAEVLCWKHFYWLKVIYMITIHYKIMS